MQNKWPGILKFIDIQESINKIRRVGCLQSICLYCTRVNITLISKAKRNSDGSHKDHYQAGIFVTRVHNQV